MRKRLNYDAMLSSFILLLCGLAYILSPLLISQAILSSPQWNSNDIIPEMETYMCWKSSLTLAGNFTHTLPQCPRAFYGVLGKAFIRHILKCYAKNAIPRMMPSHFDIIFRDMPRCYYYTHIQLSSYSLLMQGLYFLSAHFAYSHIRLSYACFTLAASHLRGSYTFWFSVYFHLR